MKLQAVSETMDSGIAQQQVLHRLLDQVLHDWTPSGTTYQHDIKHVAHVDAAVMEALCHGTQDFPK